LKHRKISFFVVSIKIFVGLRNSHDVPNDLEILISEGTKYRLEKAVFFI
jgi:hypothetical protein